MLEAFLLALERAIKLLKVQKDAKKTDLEVRKLEREERHTDRRIVVPTDLSEISKYDPETRRRIKTAQQLNTLRQRQDADHELALRLEDDLSQTVLGRLFARIAAIATKDSDQFRAAAGVVGVFCLWLLLSQIGPSALVGSIDLPTKSSESGQPATNSSASQGNTNAIGAVKQPEKSVDHAWGRFANLEPIQHLYQFLRTDRKYPREYIVVMFIFVAGTAGWGARWLWPSGFLDLPLADYSLSLLFQALCSIFLLLIACGFLFVGFAGG